jgi:dephospho-CoA kinase
MRPKRLGLTGNIGSGKSTVARLLVEKGAALIDSDALAREASEDPEVLRRIAEALGPELVKEGKLDRAATARLVFGDPQARRTLNSIIHPWVRRRSAERVAELERRPSPPPIILLDIPLLYENGLERECDGVIVVWASLETRLKRVRARSGLSEAEVRARDAAQLPLEEKVARAEFVINNDGSLEELKEQVGALWER